MCTKCCTCNMSRGKLYFKKAFECKLRDYRHVPKGGGRGLKFSLAHKLKFCFIHLFNIGPYVKCM